MKFRPQRSGLAESMVEVVELRPNIRALAKHLGINVLRLGIKPYCYDDRNGWKTCIVTVDGQAVGFTDGPCTENAANHILAELRKTPDAK